MGSLTTGGGSSAVAASAHAGCERYRQTDPLVVGRSRRKLASEIGHPDTSAGIPEARWMRAMTFERLVRHERFVSQLLTTAVGHLGLERPSAVRRLDAGVSVGGTASTLQQAHRHAVESDQATMITSLAVPFVGMENEADATPVKPDFAIVTPRHEPGSEEAVGSWLVMGDAKDYERVRSRIDDQRMLKGFLQVALGAESADVWSQLPEGMVVHRWGALAVPRNAFLQPEAIVDELDDHRSEVRARVDERTALMNRLGTTPVDDDAVADFVAHLEAAFDPATCVSCALFNYCRTEIRASTDDSALLVELGVRPELRPALMAALAGQGTDDKVPASLVASVRATISGEPQMTGQRRIDPCGQPGCINVVLAKSDAAALGVHGVALQRVDAHGVNQEWQYAVFDDSQSLPTRLRLMELVGAELAKSMADLTGTGAPLHLVVPDSVTADVLVSMADSLAGVETSRLRWQHDLDVGREALTFDGEPATIPSPLTPHQRLAVSFLLEEDRNRAMSLRWPIVDVRALVARHVVPGGPQVDQGRLDYLLEWAGATKPIDHHEVSDDIADRLSTPGARLSNARSDEIHRLSQGARTADEKDSADLDSYRSLVLDELTYKSDVLSRAVEYLERFDDSALRDAYRSLESSAQEAWRRRLALHASDLVRFGRTAWFWRNDQVGMLDSDQKCATQLEALANYQSALDLARNAGTREVATARVVAIDPIRLIVDSRRLGDGTCVVLLHVNGEPCIEMPGPTVAIQKTSLKLGQMSLASLVADGQTDIDGSLSWEPRVEPSLSVGDELVVADQAWFGVLKSGHEIPVSRPKLDSTSAPKKDCQPDSYAQAPDEHQWCCRSHEVAEAEWADVLAERRARGELNPQAWPPVIDEDQFDVSAVDAPTDADAADPSMTPPDDLTIDDLD